MLPLLSIINTIISDINHHRSLRNKVETILTQLILCNHCINPNIFVRKEGEIGRRGILNQTLLSSSIFEKNLSWQISLSVMEICSSIDSVRATTNKKKLILLSHTFGSESKIILRNTMANQDSLFFSPSLESIVGSGRKDDGVAGLPLISILFNNMGAMKIWRRWSYKKLTG